MATREGQNGYAMAADIEDTLKKQTGKSRKELETEQKYLELFGCMNIIEKKGKFTTKDAFVECLKLATDLKKTYDKCKRLKAYLESDEKQAKNWKGFGDVLMKLKTKTPKTGWHVPNDKRTEDEKILKVMKDFTTGAIKYRKTSLKDESSKCPIFLSDGFMGLMPGDLWSPLLETTAGMQSLIQMGLS